MSIEAETKIDRLMDESIKALADDNAHAGAECLVELAKAFARAGLRRSSFANIRKHLLQEAMKLDQCPLLIETKLIIAEKNLLRARNGECAIIYTGTH